MIRSFNSVHVNICIVAITVCEKKQPQSIYLNAYCTCGFTIKQTIIVTLT